MLNFMALLAALVELAFIFIEVNNSFTVPYTALRSFLEIKTILAFNLQYFINTHLIEIG